LTPQSGSDASQTRRERWVRLALWAILMLPFLMLVAYRLYKAVDAGTVDAWRSFAVFLIGLSIIAALGIRSMRRSSVGTPGSEKGASD
jgi:hypothetical protein